MNIKPRFWKIALRHGSGAVVLMVVTSLEPAAYAFNGQARETKSEVPEGFEIYLKAPEKTVIKAVQTVIENDTIQGTWIYDTDKTVTGAVPTTGTASRLAFGNT